MSEIWVYPLLIEGPKPTFFKRPCNLTAALTAYISGTKHDVCNRAKHLQSEGSPTPSQNNVNFFNKRPKIGPAFLPTLRKFCILIHCQPCFAHRGQQTEHNQSLPIGGQYIALAICRRKAGVVSLPKLGAKSLGFSTTLRLNGAYVLNEM